MIEIRKINLNGAFIRHKNIASTTGALRVFQENINALECLVNLKGRLIDKTLTYEDNLPEIEGILKTLEPVCCLEFTEKEKCRILEFIVNLDTFKSLKIKMGIEQVPKLSLGSLGIYQELIWNQITSYILEGKMDEEIAQLRATVQEDVEKFKNLIKNDRAEMERKEEYYHALEQIIESANIEDEPTTTR